MAWVETVTPSFRARHESADDGRRRARARLARRRRARASRSSSRERPPTSRSSSTAPAALLDLAHPLVPLERLLTAPAARRYVVGSTGGAATIHVLAPRRCGRARRTSRARARCSSSRPTVLYAQLVVGAQQPAPAAAVRRRRGCSARLRWAWLVEGAAQLLRRPDRARAPGDRAAPARRRAPRLPARRCATRALLGGRSSTCSRARRAARPAMRLACYLDPAATRSTRCASAFRGRSLVPHRGRLALAPRARDRQSRLSAASSSAASSRAAGAPVERVARGLARPSSARARRAGRRRASRARRSRRCAASCSGCPPPAAGSGSAPPRPDAAPARRAPARPRRTAA